MIPLTDGNGAYLVRDASGTILGGAATDVTGRWTWWARTTHGRRLNATSQAEALAALDRAVRELS